HQACLLQYPPHGRTLFRGVRDLGPGQTLVADADGTTVRTWWDCGFPVRAGAEPDVPPEAIAAALDEAVRVRLRGTGRVAVQLSGGIDSSAVAALARPAEPACFTVCFEGAGDGWDESAAAERLARALGLAWHPVQLGGEA